jgi:hypothetical protein
MGVKEETKQRGGRFRAEVLKAIRAKAPGAATFESLLIPSGVQDEETRLELVVAVPPAIYLLGVKNWHGVMGVQESGLLRLVDEHGTHRVTPDPRIPMRRSLAPLIAHRDRMAHGQVPDSTSRTPLDQYIPVSAIIVPDDLDIMPQDRDPGTVPFLGLVALLDGIRDSAASSAVAVQRKDTA